MRDYLVVFALVFGINLLPAFGPPTSSILVLYRLQSDLNPFALVLVGAVAAALGRFLLGTAFRMLRGHFSEERIANLNALRERLERGGKRTIAGLWLFALSPLPSAQLFEAAGLTGMRLLPLTVVFFAGRIVAYSIYVFGASVVRNTSVGTLVRHSFTNPVGIAIELVLVIALVAVTRVDWRKRFESKDRNDKDPDDKEEKPSAGNATR
jgi:uncharacterized membrane protein YdjX (TVP38/TMEM64 family)